MKRNAILIVTAAIMACAPFANADSDKLITEIAAQTANSLAYFTCEFEEDSATPSTAGPLICIDKSGLFLSLDFSTSMRLAKVKECKIFRPGLGSRPLAAELVGIDRGTGLAFLRCTDTSPPKWSAVEFVDKSNLSVGMQVVSVSVMRGDAAHERYLGRAYISSIRDSPESMAYVTGGRLTGVCSAVFTAPGKAIGIVWRQTPQIVELTFGRQRGMARISPMRECSFFTPVEELSHVIKMRGKRQLPWTGILSMRMADKDVLRTSKPGIRVSKIIPGGPADKAGLKELDVIVAVDGKGLLNVPMMPGLATGVLQRKINRMPIGGKITFTLASQKNVTLTLEVMPDAPTEVLRYGNRRVGVLTRDKAAIDPHLSIDPALKVDGVIVVSVTRDSPAVKGDLQDGDVITSVDAQPVRSVATIRALFKNILADGKEKTITVVVRRKDESKTLTIKVPKK